jgi:hypothetical protein
MIAEENLSSIIHRMEIIKILRIKMNTGKMIEKGSRTQFK